MKPGHTSPPNYCGVFMLLFLQKWAHDRDIQLKLFNPSSSVRLRLEQAGAILEFDIARLGEMMAMLSQADSRYALDGKGAARCTTVRKGNCCAALCD